MNLATKLISLDKQTSKRICILGDAMTDIYVHGHLEPSQDGVDKFIESSRVQCQGGADNAANCLEHWNCGVEVFSQFDGPHKTRYLADGKIVFRCDDDKISDTEDEMQEARADALERLKGFHAVLLCDYDKGFLTPEFIQAIIRLANEHKIPVMADAKRHPLVYKNAILKCNESYTSKFNNRAGWEEKDRENQRIIVTHGNNCPMIFDNTQKNERTGQMHVAYSAGVDKFVDCKNHVGAGDCFAAHLVLALAHGFSLEDAAAVAHSAGRVYVQHLHNRAPRPEEIEADMKAVQL